VSRDFFEEQQAIITEAEAFLAALRQVPRISMSEVSQRRVKLSGLIRRLRDREEEVIFAPLNRGGGLSALPHLEPHVQEVMRERARYSEHIGQWTPQAIQDDWHGYATAVDGLVRSVKQLFRGENSSLSTVLRGLTAESAGSRADRPAVR
jgi:hypothetical protein